MKKLLAFILALLMALSLVSCGGEKEKEGENDLPATDNGTEDGTAEIGENNGTEDGSSVIGENNKAEEDETTIGEEMKNVSFEATYFAFPNFKLGYSSFSRAIKDGEALASFLTEYSLASGDYSVFFEPYNSDFFEEHTLIALYFTKMLGAYPVVTGVSQKGQSLFVSEQALALEGEGVNGERGSMVLLTIDKEIPTGDINVNSSYRYTTDEEEYNAVYDLYREGPAFDAEKIEFAVLKSISLKAENVKGYECSADRALVLDSAEAFANFESQNGEIGNYDEAYFETKSLILVFARPCSSTQIPFNSVSDFYRMADGSFRMIVKYDVQQVGTSDVNWICYIVEADANAQPSAAEVQTSHVYINTWRP